MTSTLTKPSREYTHPDNKDCPYVDWRDKEYRMEGFLRWLKWRMDWSDLDHYVVNNTYRDTKRSVTKKSMTEEQKYWYCLIFGMTYQSEMAWVIYNQFPDFWEIDLEKLQEWNIANMPRQRYSRDCKYNKGRITDQVLSIRERVSEYRSLASYFESFVTESPNETFFAVYSESRENLYKFGRMTSWLLCQTLFETSGLPAKPNTMLASDPSSWSVRSGLMYVYGKDNLIEAKNKTLKLSKNDIDWVDHTEAELFDIAKGYLGKKYETIFSHYLLESHLCQYKKLMLGGDYSGHSSGDHVTRATFLSDRWPEVDFRAFFKEAVLNHHPLVRGKAESKALRNLCADTGQMINMHQDFQDMPDIYKEMEIDPSWVNGGETGERKVLNQILAYSKRLSLHPT